MNAELPSSAALPTELQQFLRELAARMADSPVCAAGPDQDATAAHRPTALPGEPLADLREIGPSTDAAERFAAVATAAGCRVHRAAIDAPPGAPTAGWAENVASLIANLPARTAYLQAEPTPALTGAHFAQLRSALEAAGVVLAVAPDDASLFTVDAGITTVWLAVAETGSLVCASAPTAARGASLIPPVHVALVAESQIVPDLFDAFAALGARCTPSDAGPPPPAPAAPLRDLPANVNFITGPSKTADIEGVLVTGMHGPGAVHIVLIAGA